MAKAVFWTHSGAGRASDAIQCIVNAHYHGSLIREAVSFVVQPVIGFQVFVTFTLDQFEYVTRTRLVATPTANAALLIEVNHKGRFPGRSAAVIAVKSGWCS